MNVSVKSIIKGLLSYTPFYKIVVRKGTGGTNSARYCYSVWLRHLILLFENGMVAHPKVIAELGPGDSLGIGFAALLTGAQEYYAFDVVKHTDLKNNIRILAEIAELIKNKTPIPDENEFPELKPKLNSYSFPSNIIHNSSKIEEKVKAIRDILSNSKDQHNEIKLKYIVPWYGVEIIEESVDLIYSQAVMEHIIDIDDAYQTMYKWLKKGGFISHQIDFRAHETHKIWNGHWKYSDRLWKIIMHGRSYPINRYPYSAHINSLKKVGFTIISTIEVIENKGYARNELKGTFRQFNDIDYKVSSAHIIGQKK